MRLPRSSVRLRLTLLYSALFLAGGAVLLTVAYGLVAARLGSQQPVPATLSPQERVACQSVAASLKGAPNGKGAANVKPSPDPSTLDAQCKALFRTGASLQRQSTLHSLLIDSLIALAATALLSAVLGWVIAGRALRPLVAITEAARRASHTTLGERIALAGPDDELKELADTFDDMLDRLDGAFASQRRFVANASHELRTPLTVMRTAIDVTLAKPERSAAQLEEMAVEVREAVVGAEALIDALLTLARSDRGLTTREAVDMATATEDALDASAAEIRDTGLTVQVVCEPARTIGDPVLLERLAANLVTNAVRYNAVPGWIRVTTGERDGQAYLEVANSGPEVPASMVEELFEPFRRFGARQPADGVGLGLAIVRSVATAHGGTVTARSRDAGGLEVAVVLPVAGVSG